jgi:hypothetical protein
MLFTICWIMFFYVKETSIIDLSVINRDSENKGRETIPMEIFSLPNSKYSFRDCPLYQCKYKTLNNTLFLNYGELSQVNIKNIPFCSDILFNRLLIFDGFSRQFSIPYYISFGTLLGSFLMQDIFPWTQDLDVVIPDHSLLALLGNEVIVEHLKRTGLIIFRGGNRLARMCFDSHGIRRPNTLRRTKEFLNLSIYMDVSAEFKKSNESIMMNPSSCVFKQNDIYPLGRCNIRNHFFPCPRNVTKVLENHYGKGYGVANDERNIIWDGIGCNNNHNNQK